MEVGIGTQAWTIVNTYCGLVHLLLAFVVCRKYQCMDICMLYLLYLPPPDTLSTRVISSVVESEPEPELELFD
jgi:hypothetical protein